MAVCPTARELEGFPPTTVNTPPDTLAPEIFTVPVPVFVTVMLCVAAVPSTTFPKPILFEDAVRTPPPELPTPPPLPLDAFVV